ncbi:hypothetical protein CEXT_469931 [Caerostris extrusa]|uniref:Uncharacterized protein n=1 Tax=Caerostris extrusa TaxID=172846 RepID=A0AAV4XXU5_CAEEX|nr:hypothetical protein CEXT_469931 [Caerostris extrusa]
MVMYVNKYSYSSNCLCLQMTAAVDNQYGYISSSFSQFLVGSGNKMLRIISFPSSPIIYQQYSLRGSISSLSELSEHVLLCNSDSDGTNIGERERKEEQR